MKQGYSILLPAYCEAENLKELLPQIRIAMDKMGEPYEIMVVGIANETDNTQSVCAENGAIHIVREGGDAYGDAIRTGINKARHEYLIVMDADGSHNPEDIIRLRQAMKEKNADLVIASRYTEGGTSCHTPILKAMSMIVNFTYRLFFAIRVKDISDSFRLYKTQDLQKIELTCDNFDVVEEILIRLSLTKKYYKIYEVPIYFAERKYGKSKRQLLKFVFSYITTIIRLLRIKYECIDKWQRVKELISFCIVGGINAVLALLIQWGLLYVGIHYEVANVISFIVTVFVSYALNNGITFRCETKGEWSIKALARVYLSYAFTGLFMSSALLFLWNDVLCLKQWIGPVINIFVTVPINFIINKFWAYKRDK